MNDSLKFMQNADLWPRWPICPVVNLKEHHKIGVVWSGDPTVFIANMHDLKGGTKAEVTEGLPKVTYTDFEELLNEWRID